MTLHFLRLLPATLLTGYVLAGLPGMALAEEPGNKLVATKEAPETDEQGKQDFVNHMAHDAMSILYDPTRPFDERRNTLKNAFNTVVDIQWIARFVLGHNWNKATEEQRDRYTTLYRRYLTKTYVSNFSENPDKKIRNIKVMHIGRTNNEKFAVRTEMLLANGQLLHVDYVVRDRNDRYKVIDISIEGISLLASHRSIFGKIIANKGMEGVLDALEKWHDNPSYKLAAAP